MTDASHGERYPAEPPPRKMNGRAPGDALRVARDALGLSLENLGEMVGRKASHLSRIETGHSTPSVELAERLAYALDLDAATLLCAYRLVPDRAAARFFDPDRMREALKESA